NNKEIIDVFTLKFVTLFDIIPRIGGMCFHRGKDKEKRKREIGRFLPGFGLWVLLLPSPAEDDEGERIGGFRFGVSREERNPAVVLVFRLTVACDGRRRNRGE
ncbi:hypothetical protein HAX54_016354, partial [Datura stramonium]|nr:hypothetical protein [Datura stramonium]